MENFYNLLKRSGCTFRNGFSEKIALGFVRKGFISCSEQVKKFDYVGVFSQASEASAASINQRLFLSENKKEI